MSVVDLNEIATSAGERVRRRVIMCSACGLPECSHANQAGVNLLSFGGHDEFYEGRFTRATGDEAEGWLKRQFRFLFYRFSLHGERARPLLTNKTTNGMTLDFGCGGGRDYLGEGVVGIDLSFESCRVASQFYDLVVHGEGVPLPFKDCVFQRVISVDVLGHIPLEQKQAVIAELFRVTRPGGTHFHFAELLPLKGWFRFAQGSSRFASSFIDMDGHISLETVSEYIARFRDAGFVVTRARPVFRYVWPAGEWSKRFGDWLPNELPWALRFIVSVDRQVIKSYVGLAAWDIILSLAAYVLDRFGGENAGTMGSFVLRRP
jgi:SAM-dependent methyltransferase